MEMEAADEAHMGGHGLIQEFRPQRREPPGRTPKFHSNEQVMRAILLDISSDCYLYADYPRVTHFGKAQSWTFNLPKESESHHAKEAA